MNLPIDGDVPASTPREDALAWLHHTELDQEADQLVQPYVDAAAVLSTFELSQLHPLGKPRPGQRIDALMELTNRCIAVGDPHDDVWQLQESSRRIALRRLGSRPAMRAAREANPGPAADPVQRALDGLIQSRSKPPLDKLSLDELLGMEQAVRWLSDVIEPLPVGSDLASRIARERQLAPMRKIAEDFVDREASRADLADYVGTLPPGQIWRGLRRGFKYVAYRIDQRPPLHLHGPGGIGKSALLARFILDHTRADDNPHPLPFVYLDFDRASLDPARPDTLLDESIRQLLVQFPAAELGLESLGDESREQSARIDGYEISKSSGFDAHENLVRRFCRVLELIAAGNDQPVLMVLDTLEEAEYQGLSAMLVTWDLLADLLRRVDRLRIVTAGRSALPSELKREPVELQGLPSDAAIDLVVQRTAKDPHGPVTKEDAKVIVNLVGTVPLSLALAAQVVLNEGVLGLRNTVSRQRMFSKIKAEQQQGMLHRRILNHVRLHDPELWKVANPGLVVRRITVDVIEQVLAIPCGLSLSDHHRAEQLFRQMSREVGLVDPYREPGALWHLPAVRRIMLPDLLATLGDLPRAIHTAAARYYKSQPGAAARAEEIYHRLWLDDEDMASLNALWRPELERHLSGTLEEFKPRARIWLGDKLGVELPAELRELAELDVWERQTERRVRTLLSRNLLSEAIAAIRERSRVQRPSPLHALEADIQKLMGDAAGAFATLTEGLATAELAGDAGARLQMVLRLMFLYEAANDLVKAWPQALLALELAQTVRDPLEALSAGAAILRLKRKVDASGLDKLSARQLGFVVEHRAFETLAEGVRHEVLTLTRGSVVRVALRSRPSLHTEVAAELGADNMELLLEAISQRGITPEDLLALRDYATGSAQDRQLPTWVFDVATSRGIGRQIAELVPLIPAFFTERLRLAVEDSLTRTVDLRGLTTSTDGSSNLVAGQIASLVELLVTRFTPQDLDLLARDVFDVSLADISDSSAPYPSRAMDLLRYAERRGVLPQLIDRLADSHRDDDDLYRLSARRQRR